MTDVENLIDGEVAQQVTPSARTEPELLHLDGALLYADKNDDYGNSWELGGRTLSLWLQGMGVDELTISTDPDTMTSLGLYFRRMDKLMRGFNGEFVSDDLNHESVFDSHHDEATYAEMHATLFSTTEAFERVTKFLEMDAEELGG